MDVINAMSDFLLRASLGKNTTSPAFRVLKELPYTCKTEDEQVALWQLVMNPAWP